MALSLPEVSGPVQTPHWAIEQVSAADAMVPWRRCWDLLSRAVERFPNIREKFSRDGLLYDVMCGNAQLWIAWSYERRHIEGAVITRLFDKPPMAPNDRICEVPLVAGDNFAEWGPSMMALLKAWALDQKCDYMAGYGRKGWKRLFGFQDMGFTSDGLPILILPLRRH